MAGTIEDVTDAALRFETFVRESGDRLLYTAYGLCGDWQLAEDLVQQALAATAQRWDRVGDNPAGYAYRCVIRANIDRWRRVRRRRETVADPAVLGSLPGAGRGAPVDTDNVDARLSAAVLLAQLPPRQRAIVVLRYLQDLSEADVADVLGISVGSVKSGASRGLARLRALAPESTSEDETR